MASDSLKNYAEEDCLLLSGIQHFAFCKRQWALIHIEQHWVDNASTVSGNLMHERAHNPALTEQRGNMLTVRDMAVFSHTMGVRGACDVVEFRRDARGVTLFGREGLWLPCPVEYKRGKPKSHDADKLQLCAQAMCLEEMLLCSPIETAYLYYGEPKRREEVQISEELRETVRTMFVQMHQYRERSYTPRVKAIKACAGCSLQDTCLPKLPPQGKVADYIKNALSEEADI